MKIAIIKYNAGNNFSVLSALHRLGVEAKLTDSPEELRSADRVIFPGVGEAASAMAYLRERNLDNVISSLTAPVLGICIGQQLLCRHSSEGDTDCIGIFDVDVCRFDAADSGLRIPHMGWNTLTSVQDGFIPQELENAYVYYVHSYFAPVCRWTAAQTDYIVPFSAALHRDNFYATQFHPEKSADAGHMILKRFLEL